MRENELVSAREAEVKYDDLTQKDVKKYAILGLQAESLQSATQIEVTTVITRITNSRNISIDGVMKGVSNRDMCNNFDVNTNMVHVALEQLGYAIHKQVTIRGFERSNGTGVTSVDYHSDIPLFYFTDDGSLYWNDLHKNFNSVWQEILACKVGTITVEDSEYNKQLKERRPAMPTGFMRMLQRHNIDIYKDGKRFKVQ